MELTIRILIYPVYQFFSKYTEPKLVVFFDCPFDWLPRFYCNLKNKDSKIRLISEDLLRADIGRSTTISLRPVLVSCLSST